MPIYTAYTDESECYRITYQTVFSIQAFMINNSITIKSSNSNFLLKLGIKIGIMYVSDELKTLADIEWVIILVYENRSIFTTHV